MAHYRDTGCGNICLAGAVVEVIGTRGAMTTVRVTTPSTSSGGGITNAQFTYINHDAYAPLATRLQHETSSLHLLLLGKTGSTVGNDKAVG